MSRQQLDGKIVHLRKGLAIYRVKASRFWYCRIWIPSKKRRIVKTTKVTTRAEAITVAEELFSAMGTRGALTQTPKNETFEFFADQLIRQERLRGERGELSPRLWTTTNFYLNHRVWGAVKYFSGRAIADISQADTHQYLDWVQQQDRTLSPGTLNHISISVRKVFKVAVFEKIIPVLFPMPRVKRKDSPRAFFTFHPLVPKKEDEWEKLKAAARKMAEEKVAVRGAIITDELYDFILFMVHSFLRPVESEIYALRHRDVAVSEPPNPKGLILTIVDGKTGFRRVHTMPAAASVYERIKKRQGDYGSGGFLFLPQYLNRRHAIRVIQNQFNAVLDRAGLKSTHDGSNKHTVYSLRHTAICMRLVIGEVNVFWLAKNSGTSVDQIERFYARSLPPSADVVRQLQRVKR